MKRYYFMACSVIVLILLISAIEKGPQTKAALGEMLFFDPILSRDRTISCASCHLPVNAFADTLPFSKGVEGRLGKRNKPSAMNVAFARSLFWDGRVATLEAQALAPIANPDEMDLSIQEALKRLNADKSYKGYFQTIFESEPTAANLGAAIAAFERTLETSDSPFDRWKINNDSNAISAAAKRGFDIFNKKGRCVKCHFGADFTQRDFRNIGLFNGNTLNDSGRIVFTANAADLGKFKTPALRNVAVTAPYMHNGLFGTLKEVIEFYNDPSGIVPDAINRDSVLITPLNLTTQEKQDLEQFLISLTDKRFTETRDAQHR